MKPAPCATLTPRTPRRRALLTPWNHLGLAVVVGGVLLPGGAARAQCPGPLFSTAALTHRSFGHSLAYDSLRGRALMFGGESESGDQFSNELRAFDGVQWTKLSPPLSPPARAEANNLVYDIARDRVVMYGGFGQSNGLDTWEFDGTTWTPRATTGPTAYGQFAMAYDAARQRTVHFGGNLPPNGNRSNQTWLWNGTAWSLASPATSPPPITGPLMTYDPVRQRVVMFGGTISNTEYNTDVWEWNGATWAMRTIAGPRPATATAMCYDGARQKIVCINQQGNFGPECWELGDAGWTLMTNVGAGLCFRGDGFGPMVFHAAVNKTLVTFDGGNQNFGEPSVHSFYGPTDAPRIITQPDSQTTGDNGVFFLRIKGTCVPGATYRWRRNGQPIFDASFGGGYRNGSATESLYVQGSFVNSLAEGWYDCVMTTPCGTATSEKARVTITCDPTNIEYETPPTLVTFVLQAFDGTELGTFGADFLGAIGLQFNPHCTDAPFAVTAAVTSFDSHSVEPTVQASWVGGSVSITGGGLALDPLAPPALPARVNGNRADIVGVPVKARGTMTYNAFGLQGVLDLSTVAIQPVDITGTFDGPYGPNITAPFAAMGELDIGLGPLNPILGISTTIRAPYPHCPADMDNGSGSGFPDDGVTIDDLLYYLTQFAGGNLAADVDDGGGNGTRDGGVTIDDLLFYIGHFTSGC